MRILEFKSRNHIVSTAYIHFQNIFIIGEIVSTGREFLELGSLLLLGCGIAATIQTLIPRDLFLAVGQAPTLSVLSLMLLAVVVSVCSSVDAFLALGFAAMVTPGALLAFLLLGPVIDLKSISLFSRIFRRRGILLMLAGVVVSVLLIGQWLNLVLL